MKKLVTLMMLLLLAAGSFGQKATPSSEEYLKKSKNTRNLAWVLVGGGVLLAVIGGVVAASEVSYALAGSGSSNTGEVMAGIGGVFVIGSIPLFISAGVNKRKARNASANLKVEKIYIPNVATHLHCFPALSIKVNL